MGREVERMGWDGMGWGGDEFGVLFSLLIYLRYQPTSMYLMVVRSSLLLQIYSKVIQVHFLLKTSLVVIGIPRLN